MPLTDEDVYIQPSAVVGHADEFIKQRECGEEIGYSSTHTASIRRLFDLLLNEALSVVGFWRPNFPASVCLLFFTLKEERLEHHEIMLLLPLVAAGEEERGAAPALNLFQV